MKSELSLHHFELESGGHAHVPRHLVTPLSGAVARAISRSFRLMHHMSVEDTPFQMSASLQHVSAGFAVFTLLPSDQLKKVRQGCVLIHGAIAVELATAPLAWRRVFGPMLSSVAAAPGCLSWHAPREMPKQMPWLVSFSTHRMHALSATERDQAREVTRLAGVHLVEACLAGSSASRRAGETFALDYEQFPELADLES